VRILVDTTIWSLALRRKRPTTKELILIDELTELVKELRAVLIGPVRQEVLSGIPDPARFGVAEIHGSKIVQIQEKPQKPKSDLAVVGLYFFDKSVFDIIRKIHPSKRGELEITAVNNFFLQEKSLDFRKIKGFWKDAGTFVSLAEATKFIREKTRK